MLVPRRSPTSTRLHAVHDVADDELRVLVDDDDGPAVAPPVTGARAERHLGRIAQAVAHAHALGHAEHLVDAVRLDLEDRVGALGREQAHATGFAPSGDDRLDGGHRAGIALAVGGGDLGAPPPFLVRHGGVDGRVHECLQHELGDLALHGGDVDGRGRDDVGHAAVLARRQADEEVGAERLGHLAGEPGADAVAGDATDDLADEVALRQRVVPRAGAGLPPRRLRSQPGDAELPVSQVLGGERLFPATQPRRVPHDVPDLDPLLAVGGELGPVRGDGRMEVEFLPVVQHEGDEEGHGLGGGPDVRDGVALPGSRLLLVGPAAPDVDDRLPVQEDGDRGTEVRPCLELVGQRGADGFEAWLVGSVHLCHGDPFSCRWTGRGVT